MSEISLKWCDTLLRDHGLTAQIGNEKDGKWVCKFWNLGRCLVVGSGRHETFQSAVYLAFQEALENIKKTA